MHDNAGDLRQQAAPLGRDAVEGEQTVEATCSHCVLPPIRKPVSSICLTGAAATWSRTASAKPWKRSAQSWLIRAMVAVTSLHPEQVSHQRGQTLLRQQLVVQQIEHEGADPFAVLHRRSHPIGECRPRLAAARRTAAAMGAVFGDDQRLWFGQIEHLPGDMAGRHRLGQRFAARGTVAG